MSDPIAELQPTVQAWADIVLKEFDKKVRMLHIHEGNLVNSFIAHVLWHAGGDLQRVEFAFEYYGKFVDMGTGRGVNMNNRDAMIGVGATTRRPKPWFTDTFYKQLAVLRGILSERLAQNTQLMIVRNVRDTGDLRKPMQL